MFLTLLVASTSHKTLKNIYYNNDREPRGGEGATAFEKRETVSQNVQGLQKTSNKNKQKTINQITTKITTCS